MSYPATFGNEIQRAPFLEGEGAPFSKSLDPTVPSSLLLSQEWMGKWIATPLSAKQTLRGEGFQEEATLWISPSPTLAPHQRVEIYSQQYWWRLLGAMEGYHPLTRRVLGKEMWNKQVAGPYLHAHPPRHWALQRINDRLLEWLKKTPCGEHPGFTYDAACLDYAYVHAAHLPHFPILKALQNEADLELLFSKTLFTQPHLFLLAFPCDLFTFREEVLKTSGDEKDYYMTHPLPVLDLVSTLRHFILFRTADQTLKHQELSSYEARYLRHFLEGSSIESSLEWIETQEKAMQEAVQKHLVKWLEQWIALGLLTDHHEGAL